jgi:beta-lactamase class A
MITRSSNPATNTLIELVGGAAVTRRMRQLGRGIPDGAKANRLIADVSRLVYQHYSALHNSP